MICKVLFTCWFISSKVNYHGKISNKMLIMIDIKRFFKRNSLFLFKTFVLVFLTNLFSSFNIQGDFISLSNQTMKWWKIFYSRHWLKLDNRSGQEIYIAGKKHRINLNKKDLVWNNLLIKKIPQAHFNKKTVSFQRTLILINLILLIQSTNKNLTILFNKLKDKTLSNLIHLMSVRGKTQSKMICLEPLEIKEAVLTKAKIILSKQKNLKKINLITIHLVKDFLSFRKAEIRTIIETKALTILLGILKTQISSSFEKFKIKTDFFLNKQNKKYWKN